MLSYRLACTQTQKKQTNKQTNKQTINDSFVNLSLDVHLVSRYAHHCMLWIYHFSMSWRPGHVFACITARLQCYEDITEGLIGSKGHILPPFSFTWAANHSPWMCRQKMVHTTACKSPCTLPPTKLAVQKSREGLVSSQRRTGWRLVNGAS